jgi:hypothetical protein
MKRKTYTDNPKIQLFNEVDGLCPLCNISLIYTKNEQKHKRYELAHIYPHSATKEEEIILKNVERLSKNVDDVENIICLCVDCHTKFDKPRTLEEYDKVLFLKKQLIKDNLIKEKYYTNNIESEISYIINFLTSEETEDMNIELEYNPKIIDDKDDGTLGFLLKRNIKQNSQEFYFIIQKEFSNLDSFNDGKSELIATQIKLMYQQIKTIIKNQNEIFNSLVDWLYKKTASHSKPACEIIISFYIQNCEVF